MDAEKDLGHSVSMPELDEKHRYEREFVARVRAARIATGKKQWEVAELMNIQQGQYKHFEVNRVIPHHLIGRFCLITNVDPNWLLTGRGSKPLQPPHIVSEEDPPVRRPRKTKRPRAA